MAKRTFRSCPHLGSRSLWFMMIEIEPTKTQSRHMEFGGNFISPVAAYSGIYRDLVSALGLVGACANTAAARLAQTINAIAIAGTLWGMCFPTACR